VEDNKNTDEGSTVVGIVEEGIEGGSKEGTVMTGIGIGNKVEDRH